MNNLNQITDIPTDLNTLTTTGYSYWYPDNKEKIFTLALEYYMKFFGTFNLKDFENFYREFKRIYNEV